MQRQVFRQHKRKQQKGVFTMDQHNELSYYNELTCNAEKEIWETRKISGSLSSQFYGEATKLLFDSTPLCETVKKHMVAIFRRNHLKSQLIEDTFQNFFTYKKGSSVEEAILRARGDYNKLVGLLIAYTIRELYNTIYYHYKEKERFNKFAAEQMFT